MNEASEYIYGIRSILEALSAKAPINQILIGNYINLKQNKQIDTLVIKAKSLNINVKKVDKSLLEKLSNGSKHQGVLAEVSAFKYNHLSDIIEATKQKTKSLIVVLDHIEDSGNLGAIARSAEAFGADGLIIANKRAAKVTASTYKTSAGAIFNLPIAMVANINAALEELKTAEFWIASASEHAEKNIWDENLKGKLVLVLGSEHDGVSQLVLKNSDFCIKLPLQGKVESLNVAQAATACMYEWVRQNA